MVTIQELVGRSKRATCGAFEKEVVVKRSNKAAAIALLKSKGFLFVGSGPAGRDSVKIWFVNRGAALL